MSERQIKGYVSASGIAWLRIGTGALPLGRGQEAIDKALEIRAATSTIVEEVEALLQQVIDCGPGSSPTTTPGPFSPSDPEPASSPKDYQQGSGSHPGGRHV